MKTQIPKRHNGEKYKTVLGACVVCRGEDGDRGCDFCDLAYCDSGCFEEHIEDGEADGRNCDMEHIKGKEGWGAENWGGDPKGKLALALQKARDKAKEPKKPLKIEKLGVETSGQYCEYCEEHHPDEVWDICNAHHYDKYAYAAESFATEGKFFVCDACEETLPLKLRNRSLKVAQEFGMGIGDICRPCVKRIKSYEEEVKKLNPPKTWADYYNAPTKGIDTFTQPFEESSLDSGGLKKVLVGLAIGGLAYLGYNKWK